MTYITNKKFAEETIPSEATDGDAINLWVDLFGRQILGGYNTGNDAIDVTETNPSQLLTLEQTLLDAVTASGASANVDLRNYNKTTIHIIASSVSSGATVDIEHSLDGTNYHEVATTTISSDGVTEVVVEDRKYKYVRANISSYTDGTYSVLLLAGN